MKAIHKKRLLKLAKHLEKGKLLLPGKCAREWFGLSDPECEHLFIPSGIFFTNQQPDLYGGRTLSADATPKQVARNIRAFIKKKEANAKQPA